VARTRALYVSPCFIRQHSLLNWPLIGYVCFTDGAFKADSHNGAAGIILYKDSIYAHGSHYRFRAASALVSEAIAIKQALIIAADLCIDTIWFGSDCSNLIDAINRTKPPPWCIVVIINDIWAFCENKFFPFHYIPRLFNFAAHWIASNSIIGNIPPDCFIAPPVGLMNASLYGSF
jgi:hypothetical protein